MTDLSTELGRLHIDDTLVADDGDQEDIHHGQNSDSRNNSPDTNLIEVDHRKPTFVGWGFGRMKSIFATLPKQAYRDG
jgi:hypothetical protein